MTEKKKRAKRTPEQRIAMKYAYWNKWCPGGNPEKVLRTTNGTFRALRTLGQKM